MDLEQKVQELEERITELEKRLIDLTYLQAKGKAVLPDYLFTVDEVSKILKVNNNCVYDLIKKGHITALKLGRYKVTKYELIRFLKSYNGKDMSDLDNIKDLEVM